MADPAGQSRPHADAGLRQAPAGAAPQPGAFPAPAATGGGALPGEPRLHAELVSAGAAIRRYFHGLSGNWHLAEDLAQETLLKAWQARERFDGRSAVATWLFTIARNTWVSQLRRRGTEQLRLHTMGTDATVDDRPPGAGLAQAELAAAVARAMEKLPPEQREALALRESEGLTFDQISQVVGAPSATVKSRVRYALLKLAEELKGFGPEMDG